MLLRRRRDISAETIFRRVWGRELRTEYDRMNLRQLIRRVRHMMNEDGQTIATHPGVRHRKTVYRCVQMESPQ